jgi:hypothetical protein
LSLQNLKVPAIGEYCAYRHFSDILASTGLDWPLAMFTVYFDDSGTHSSSEIAVAACYISTDKSWGRFVKAWDDARWEEGFEAFHMANFAAKPEMGHEPFCRWDNVKKDHVYGRLAKIINDNKWIGIAAAVPTKSYDLVPERHREYHGRTHYAFAVRACMQRIAEWRRRYSVTVPMQYIFDWTEKGLPEREEIEDIWGKGGLLRYPKWEQEYGMQVDGCNFKRKETFKPLQAADILAWQMNNHVRKVMPLGRDDMDSLHFGFEMLRTDQEMCLGFYTEEQISQWVKNLDEYEATHGSIYENIKPE